MIDRGRQKDRGIAELRTLFMMFNSNLKRKSTANSNPSIKSHDNTVFQKQHALEFGLEITQRDPKTLKVCSVRGQFCSLDVSKSLEKKEIETKQKM